jgi:hypothetical protein
MAAETGAWLADLEEKVRAAVERLTDLRQENQSLATRVQDLEAQLAARRDSGAGEAAGKGSTAAASNAAAESAAWQEERRQVRAHVERLTTLLEDLLAETG